MLDELGYVYAIYDFIDYERIDYILLDLMKLEFRITDCSGSYDTMFVMKSEEELIKDASVILLFFTKQMTYTKRFIEQLEVVKNYQKKVISVMLDAPGKKEIPEDMISFIQGKTKIKAYKSTNYEQVVMEVGERLKLSVDQEKKEKLCRTILYVLDLIMLFILIFASVHFVRICSKVGESKQVNTQVSIMKNDSGDEVQ